MPILKYLKVHNISMTESHENNGSENLGAVPESTSANEKNQKNSHLIPRIVLQLVSFLIIVGACFFGPAGTFNYWQAWVFICIFFTMMLSISIYLLVKDPALLARRLDRGESRKDQKLAILISSFLLLALFLLPGFDHRYQWSNMPWFLVVVGNLLFFVGYYFNFKVFQANSYASRVVKVEKDTQKVITTGPYAIVRHPMYLAIIIMFGAIPLALGSYWSFIPWFFLIFLLGFRTIDEEILLMEELEGYRAYMEKTKYRIFPGIW